MKPSEMKVGETRMFGNVRVERFHIGEYFLMWSTEDYDYTQTVLGWNIDQRVDEIQPVTVENRDKREALC